MMGGQHTARIQSAVSLLALAALACAMFGCAASVVIGVAVAANMLDQPTALAYRMALKASVFAVVAAAAFLTLRRVPVLAENDSDCVPHRFASARAIAIAALLGLGVLLFLPRLNSYPYPEPDELHHLVVARNIAVYGEYASGQPPEPLVHFDPYDSVGPAVLVPVAASLKTAGVSLMAGRVSIVLSFLILIVLTIRLFAPLVGSTTALLGGLFLLLAWGSIYLARTLYGEVPALMFFVAALLSWRRSLHAFPWIWAAAAGMLLGLATLSKAIILLTAFPFAAVVLHDRIIQRRLRLPHVLLPAVGVITVQALWLIMVAIDSDTAAEGSTIGLYQHYLMFGLQSLPAAAGWIGTNQGIYMAAAVVGLLALAPAIMAERDPAVRVAVLTAVLYVFWWCFFTDAHIPRYLWFSIGLLAYPFAYILRSLAALSLQRPFRLRAIAAAALVLICCLPFGPLMKYEVDRIFGSVQTGMDERRLMWQLAEFPPNTALATTWWPLERWSHFFLDRPMAVVKDPTTALDIYDVVVVRDRGAALGLNRPAAARRMGAYTLYWKEY